MNKAKERHRRATLECGQDADAWQLYSGYSLYREKPRKNSERGSDKKRWDTAQNGKRIANFKANVARNDAAALTYLQRVPLDFHFQRDS